MNIAEALRRRAELIAWHVSYRKRGNRWEGYDPNRNKLDWKWYGGNDGVQYWLVHADNTRYAWSNWARIEFTGIKFAGVKGLTFADPIELESKVIDAQSRVLDNRHGVDDIQQKYSGTFTETASRTDRFLTSIETGIKASIGTGEGSPVSASVEVSTTVKAEYERIVGKETSVSRTIETDVNVPKGKALKVWGERKVGKMRQVVTGKTDLEHKIWIGSYQSHHLGKDRWDWTYSWDSFEEFMAVVKGERNGDLYSEFRNDILPAHMVTELSAPTNAEVNRPYEFDNVTSTQIRTEDITNAL